MKQEEMSNIQHNDSPSLSEGTKYITINEAVKLQQENEQLKAELEKANKTTRFIEQENCIDWRCEQCNEGFGIGEDRDINDAEFNYCYNCGAKIVENVYCGRRE